MLICRKRASRCPIFLFGRMPVPNDGSHSTFSSNAISVPGSRHTATCGAPAAAKPRVIEIAEFGRHQLVLDPGRPGRDMVQTIVTHRRDSFSYGKPGWLVASTSRRRVSFAGCCPNLPALSPSHHPEHSLQMTPQEANITHSMDCSEAQMPSLVETQRCGSLLLDRSRRVRARTRRAASARVA